MKVVGAPVPQKVDEPTNFNHTPTSIPSNLSTSQVENLIGTQLGDYVKGCTSKHTCGGYLKLSEPVKVTYNKTESITIQVPQELRDGKLAPYKYAKKSPGSWSSDGSFDRAEKKRAELFLQQHQKESNVPYITWLSSHFMPRKFPHTSPCNAPS